MHIQVLEFVEIIVKFIMTHPQESMLCPTLACPLPHLDLRPSVLGKPFSLSLQMSPHLSHLLPFVSPLHQNTSLPTVHWIFTKPNREKEKQQEYVQWRGKSFSFCSPQYYWLILPQVHILQRINQRQGGGGVGGKRKEQEERKKN